MRTVEIGHIFKLGYKYTEALGVTVLGADGERVTPIMGSYGIGVERAMAAIVECHHDDAGIVWPVQVAPAVGGSVPVGRAGGGPSPAADLHDRLTEARIEPLLDDRDERPGVKFRDVELIGIPFRVTVGSQGLANGAVSWSSAPAFWSEVASTRSSTTSAPLVVLRLPRPSGRLTPPGPAPAR